jgi:hypothetical protein
MRPQSSTATRGAAGHGPAPWNESRDMRSASLALAMLLLTSCAQVNEKMFTLSCPLDREPMAGEMAPGTGMAIDVSTSRIPLLSAPHRIVATCDLKGNIVTRLETPVETGLSQLSTPLSTAASHVTYVP